MYIEDGRRAPAADINKTGDGPGFPLFIPLPCLPAYYVGIIIDLPIRGDWTAKGVAPLCNYGGICRRTEAFGRQKREEKENRKPGNNSAWMDGTPSRRDDGIDLGDSKLRSPLLARNLMV